MIGKSRRFLALAGIYAVNQISLFVTFKVSAETASPSAHVALLTIHSIGTFVAMLADLGYSRPAYRNIAQLEGMTRQADYYFRVNLQRSLILLVALPAVLFVTGFGDASGYAIVLGALYVIGAALRSQWIFASEYFFRFALTTEFMAGLWMIGLMLMVWFGVVESAGYTILAALAFMRLAPLIALSARVFGFVSSVKNAFHFDREVFVESFVSAGIKIVLLFSHYSNSIILLAFFHESQVSDYLHAEKLFYAGLGVFAFASSDLIRMAARGVFKDLPWHVLAAVVFCATALGVGILIPFTPFVIALVFSEAYASAGTPLNWMLAGFPFVAANIVIANAYVSTRQYDRLILRCTALASIANIAVISYAVFSNQPNVGAFGVIASEALGSLILSVALLRSRYGARTEA